jgi:hypothetical protein
MKGKDLGREVRQETPNCQPGGLEAIASPSATIITQFVPSTRITTQKTDCAASKCKMALIQMSACVIPRIESTVHVEFAIRDMPEDQ